MKNSFFTVLSVEDFIEELHTFSPLSSENIVLEQADGRVLAADVIAGENLPLAPRSCMDGYALRAQDVFGASEMNPAYLECVGDISIARPADFSLGDGECAAIVTGGILPQGADAVVMVEHTEPLGADTIEIRKSLAPHEHVMFAGEDTVVGQVALPSGTVVRPQEVGLLAALGVQSVSAHRVPKVGIISTGDELVSVDVAPRVGQVRDVNSYTLSCLVKRAGGVSRCYGIVLDELDSLVGVLEQALQENDTVFLSGGSSVGSRDITIEAIQRIEGATVITHGVAISPGKPLILARVGNKSIWGLPGQVASAHVVMFVLGVPFLRYLAGEALPFRQERWPSCRALLARNVPSKQGREDYVRVKLSDNGEHMVATPLHGKSGLLRTMLAADGVIRIPAGSEGGYEGTLSDVLLF